MRTNVYMSYYSRYEVSAINDEYRTLLVEFDTATVSAKKIDTISVVQQYM